MKDVLNDTDISLEEVIGKISYNYLILKNIFTHLDQDDLKNVRQTCRFWNDIASSILYSKSCILLNDSEKLTDYIYNYCQTSSPQSSHLRICDINFTEEDLTNLEVLWTCPATDELVSLEIDLAPVHGTAILRTLFQTRIFPELERLKIRVLKFYNVHDDDETVDIGHSAHQGRDHSNFPQLKSFNYTYYSFDGSDYSLPVKWENMLEQFYNLQELFLTGVSSLELHEVMDALWVLRETNPENFNIQKFQALNEDILPETPDNSHLMKLIQLNLPLTSLHLEIGSAVDPQVLQSILTNYGPSLQELQLRKYPTPIFTLVQVSELTRVIFIGLAPLLVLDISDEFLPSLDFLLYLPNLTRLTLSNRNPSKLSETKMIQNSSWFLQPCLSLTSLNIEENVTTNCFKRICHLFPLLEHLQLRMDDEMLRILFVNLTQLKSLYIIGKFSDEDDENIFSGSQKITCSDKGITGIPIRYMTWGNVNIKKNRMFPYIGDLQKLEKLTIECWGNYGVGVSNLSIYYGLVELPNLKKVKFIRTLVTEDGVEILCSKGVHVSTID